jgi:hypothetical protein
MVCVRSCRDVASGKLLGQRGFVGLRVLLRKREHGSPRDCQAPGRRFEPITRSSQILSSQFKIGCRTVFALESQQVESVEV